MGVRLLHDSLKLSYNEALVSQVLSAHSLTPGAPKPASDLKSAWTNQHLMGQPLVCPCHWCQHWNAEEDIKPTNRAGQAQGFECKRLNWADVEARCSRQGAGGACMERAWDRMVALPEVPRGQEPLKGTAFAGHKEAADPVWHTGLRVTLHHVAVTCKITQWPNIPWLYTRCSAEEVEY